MLRVARMTEEHPFAEYVRILGKGRNGSKTLTQAQAYAAMRMILAGEALPMQVGAFLMLIRVREETGEETAGFVAAARDSLTIPEDAPAVRLDWSSYAGKRRHLPWFVLAALLLARNGVSVFMHGIGGRDDGRIYAPEALASLGIFECKSLAEVTRAIKEQNFAFAALGNISPAINHLINLRPLLGLRSPINTVARMLNPFRAPVLMQGIFHPGYRDIHQSAALLLQQPHMAVLKGEGGEIERNPDTPCLVKSVHEGVAQEEEWPAMFTARHLKDQTMDVQRLGALWRGDIEDEYGEATVVGTTAIALKALGQAGTMEAAQALATDLWKRRPVAWQEAA
jgi:anthranilate phosphoribosyltransferase